MHPREQTYQTAFRLPLELIERIDAHAARLRSEQPGVNVSRTDVVRLLLTRAFDALDSERAPSPAKASAKLSKRP